MGKKYIIELEEPEMFDGRKYYQCSQMTWWSVSESIVENLTPYTEPDLEQVRIEAYQEGKKQAKVQAELDVCHDIEKVSKENYKAGLSDAWEAVRKIYDISQEDRLEIFPEASTFVVADICDRYSASECIEKIRQYEQEKEEQIQIGDEIETPSGLKGYVVNFTDDELVHYVSSEGRFGTMGMSAVSKTGRHFPEIAEVLAKMKEANNG